MNRQARRCAQLRKAVERDDVAVVSQLLASGTDPYLTPKGMPYQGGREITVFELAVQLGRYTIAERILELRPSTHTLQRAIKRSYTHAMEKADAKMIGLLERHVAGYDLATMETYQSTVKSRDIYSPKGLLETAIIRDGKDDGKRVEALIAVGCKVDGHGHTAAKPEKIGWKTFQPKFGPTMLQLAFRAGNFRNFTALMEAGAPVDMNAVGATNDLPSPLAMACLSPNFTKAKPFIDALLAKKASLYTQLGPIEGENRFRRIGLPFHLIHQKRYEALEYLLSHNVSANSVASDGGARTYLLHFAASQDDARAVAILLKHGADVHAQSYLNPSCLTVLDEAKLTDEAVLPALMAAGADMHETAENQLASTFSRHPQRTQLIAYRDTARDAMHAHMQQGTLTGYLLQGKEPTPALLALCGSGLLAELFSPLNWKGNEAEGYALWDKVSQALPPYWQEKLKEQDISELRRESTPQASERPMAERFARKRQGVIER